MYDISDRYVHQHSVIVTTDHTYTTKRSDSILIDWRTTSAA